MPIVLSRRTGGSGGGNGSEPSDPVANGRILTPGSPEFSSCGGLWLNDTAQVSGQWNTANDPSAVAFTLPRGGLVKQLGWVNGTAAGGNHDIGIYDTSWNRLVSAGSTVGSGNSVWQWVNVADTELAAGRYHLAIVRDNITLNRVMYYVHAQQTYAFEFMGGSGSTTDSFPLPNPLVGMGTPTLTLVPVMGIAFRDPF